MLRRTLDNIDRRREKECESSYNIATSETELTTTNYHEGSLPGSNRINWLNFTQIININGKTHPTSCLTSVYKTKVRQIVRTGIADFLIPIKYSVYTTQKGVFRSTNRQIPFKIYLYYILIPCSSYLHYIEVAKIGEVLLKC